MPEIDKLEIAIEAKSKGASDQIDALIGKLDSLSSALARTATTGFKSLSDAANHASTSIRNLSTSINNANLNKVNSQLMALGKIDLSNLNKGVKIDIKFDGANKVQKEAIAIQQSTDVIWKTAEKEADAFLARYRITGKEAQKITREIFKQQVGNSFGLVEGSGAIDAVFNTLVRDAKMTKGELDAATTGYTDGLQAEWKEFLDYVNKHKIKYIQDVQDIAKYSEEVGRNGSLTSIFSKTGKINLDTGYEELQNMFPNILRQIEGIGNRTEYIIEKIKEAKQITTATSVSDLGSSANDAVLNDYIDSIRRASEKAREAVDTVKNTLQTDKIAVDIAVNQEKILSDIQNAVNRASSIKYNPVNVDLRVNTQQIKHDIAGQFEGISLEGIESVNLALQKLNTTIRQLTEAQTGANFGKITNFVKNLSEINMGNASTVSTSLSELSTGIAEIVGASGNSDAISNIKKIANALKKIQEVDPAKLQLVGQAITELAANISGIQSGTDGSNNLVEILKTIRKFSNKGISAAIQNIPNLAKAINELLTSLASAPAINPDTLATLQAAAALRVRSGADASQAQGQASRAVPRSSLGSSIGSAGAAARSAVKGVGSGLGKASQAIWKANKGAIQVTASLYSKLGGVGKSAIVAGKRLFDFSRKTSNSVMSVRGLASALGRLYAKFFILRRVVGWFSEAFTSAMDYIESYHYFEVAFDKIGEGSKDQFSEFGYESAEAYADSFKKRALALNEKMSGFRFDDSGFAQSTGEKSLGLDSDQVLQFQAQYAQMADSMGMTGEAASATSKALTMLATDWSSLRNMSFEDSFQKMTSALAGQSRAVRTLGIDITQASLAETAARIGMTQSITKMSQVEKAELRVITMLEQSRVAWGDLAKTLNTPANQLRMLQQNLKSLARTIGNLFLPVLAKIIPYINGIVIALQRLFQWIANVLGLNAAELVSSAGGLDDALGDLDTDDFTEGVKDADDALKEAEEDAEELVKTILGFDELNILNPPEEKKEDEDDKNKADEDAQLADLGLLDSALLDLLDEYEKAWEKAFEDMASAAHDFAAKLEEIGRKIWDFIKNKDYEGLGEYLAEGVNWILQKLYDLLDPERFRALVYPIIDAFTETFNSLVDHINWGLLGEVLGRGLNDLLDAAIRFIEGMNWGALGQAFAKMINGLFGEVEWDKLGRYLADKFMAAIDFLRGFLEELDGKQVGESLANMLNSAMDFIDWQKVGDTLALGLNKAIDILDAFIDTFHWDDLANNLSSLINSFIEGVEWARLGQVLGKLVDKLLHTFFKCVAQIKWNELAIGVVNGLTMFIASIHWEERAAELAAAFNSILNGIYTAITNFDFKWAGSRLGAALKVLLDEVDWGMLGYNLLGAINGVLLYVQGIIETPGFFESLGTAFAGFINGALDVGTLDTATDLLIDAFNGVVDSLKASLEDINWDELKRQLVFNINKLIRKIDLHEAAETLKFFFKQVVDVLWTVAEECDWESLGSDIKDFIVGIPWLSLAEEAVAAILEIVGKIWEGLGNDLGGLIIKGIIAIEVAKKLMPFIDSICLFLTGSPLVGVKLGNAGKSLLGQALSEGAQKAAPLVSANLAPVIEAVNGAFVFTGAVTAIVNLCAEFDKLGDKAMGGNGAISEYGMVVDGVIKDLQPKLGEHFQQIFDIKEELENAHAPAEEFGEALKKGLEDAGISERDAEEAVNRVKDGLILTNEQMGILDTALAGYKENVKEYKDEIDFSETGVGIEEFRETLQENLSDISVMLGGSETDFNNLSALIGNFDENANAQQLFEAVKQRIEELGIPLDGLMGVIEEKFPEAVRNGTSSAASEAESGTGQLKTHFENAFGEIEATATRSIGTVNEKIGEAGSSAGEAEKNLDPFTTLINDLAANTSLSDSVKIAIISAAIGAIADGSGESQTALHNLSEEISTYASNDDLISHTNDIVTALEDSGTSIDGFCDAIEKSFGDTNTAITPTIAEILAQIEGMAREVDEQSKTAGENMPEGVNVGMNDKIAEVTETVKRFGQMIISTFKGELDENSPSRVFRESGWNIDLGLANGIEEFKSEPIDAIKMLAIEMQNEFGDIVRDIPDAFSNISSDIASNFYNVGNEISNAIGDMFSLGRDVSQAFADGIQSVYIKLPHVYWSGDLTHTYDGGTIYIPQFAVEWYASGGFPTVGDLFMANERGPEMVGKMGHRNVVANNMQIVEGIKEGFIDAVMEVAMSGGSSDDVPYQMNINLVMPDGEVLARQVDRGRMKREERFRFA